MTTNISTLQYHFDKDKNFLQLKPKATAFHPSSFKRKGHRAECGDHKKSSKLRNHGIQVSGRESFPFLFPVWWA
jgi:hypothetical protein